MRLQAPESITRWICREGTWHCFGHDAHFIDYRQRNPLGVPGDLLYVRETWRQRGVGGNIGGSGTYALIEYRASFQERWGHDGEIIMEYADKRCYPPGGVDISESDHRRWRPSIHMPKWAARLWVVNTGVRVERGPYISEEDAIAEGFEGYTTYHTMPGEQFVQEPDEIITPAEEFMAWWAEQYPGMDWRFVTCYEVTER